MSWNKCLYAYHQTHGGQLLAGEARDGLLVFTWKDQPLIVDLSNADTGKSFTVNFVRARIPVTLARPYTLTIGSEKATSGGVNMLLRALPGLPVSAALPADFGYPEIPKKRLIRSNDHNFTKLTLGSLDLRSALAACPEDRVELHPGPGDEGRHLITVITDHSVDSLSGDGNWHLGEFDGIDCACNDAQMAQRIAESFFPRMDRFLGLCKAAYSAVTQWRM